MLKIYELADHELRQEIIHFYGNYINCYFYINDSLVVLIAKYWSQEHHQIFCDFIKDLLALPDTRWVPPQDMDISDNPLAVLIHTAKTQPLANAFIQILIDYCLHQAKDKKDPQFLLPIKQCLHQLLDPDGQYSEMALNIYREMTFFPTQGRDFLLEHHALSNPPNFLSIFWKPCRWGLDQYKDQVLELETVKIPKPPKGNFTRQIFQASFDMLWHKLATEESQGEPDKNIKTPQAQVIFSWPKAIWNMALRICKLKHHTTIVYYPFERKLFDNPALIALVEYKW
jgi:hypothetical protein